MIQSQRFIFGPPPVAKFTDPIRGPRPIGCSRTSRLGWSWSHLNGSDMGQVVRHDLIAKVAERVGDVARRRLRERRPGSHKQGELE